MKLARSEIASGEDARIAKKLASKRRLQQGRWGWKAALAVTAVFATAFVGATSASRAANSPACPSATQAPYSMQLKALTGPAGADLTVSVAATSGCALPEVLKKIQLRTCAADG